MRLAVVLAVTAVAVAAAWWSGALAPHLGVEARGGEWTSGAVIDGEVVDVEVTLRFEVHNRGRLDATVTGWDPPDTSGLDWAAQVEPPTVDLAPGESADLDVRLVVPRCGAVHADGTQELTLRAYGPAPVSVPRTTTLRNGTTTPPWMDRAQRAAHSDDSQPSWIYEALAWPCDPSAQEDT